jgi:hypothetical protein
MAKNLRTSIKQSIKASSKASLTGGNVFGTSPLDLRFALQKTLDPRVTFTRASTGTYVGGDGVLRSAVTNLLLRSEEFGTTWTPTGASVSSNVIAAPNGSLTTDALIEDSSTGDHRINQASLSLSNGFCTYSVYLKASTRSAARIQFDGGVGGTASSAVVDINLSTGITSGLAVTGNITSGSAVVSVLPDGWYRVSLTASLSAAATGISTRIFLLQSAGGASSYTGNGTGSVFAWGAQLEQASTVGEYIPTTSTINSAPRFDHNPTTGESLGLLVEEARTNLLLRSEEFDNASWTKVALTTTPNTTTAPNGTITADSVIPNTATTLFYTQQNVTTTASTIYTWSVYVKANGFSWVFLDAFDGSNHRTWFDIANGVVGTVEAGNTSTITSVGNGWYRCTLTRSSAGGSIAYALVLVSGNNAISGTGNSTNGVYAWGAQLEQGAFATSYIPTTSATVTRAADVASVTETNFSSWYNQTEGTVFVDVTARPDGLVCNFDDGSFNNRKPQISIGAGAACDGAYITAGSIVASFSQASTSSQRNLIATAYATDNYGFTSNGATPAQDSLGTLPSTVTTLRFGKFHTGAVPLYGTIKRLTYWPIRLPNPTLQAITAS